MTASTQMPLTEKEMLAALMDNACRFTWHYLGNRRGQGKILRILRKNGDLTQHELKEMLGIQAGSVSELLAKMEASGLIQRKRDQQDRRRILVSITEKGVEDLLLHEKQRIRRQAVLYDCLTGEECRELIRLLSKLKESWTRLPPIPGCEQGTEPAKS